MSKDPKKLVLKEDPGGFKKQTQINRVLRKTALCGIPILALSLNFIDYLPPKVDFVVLISVAILIVLQGFSWILIVCPRCEHLFFYKYEEGFPFFKRKKNIFSNECLNCGLSLNKENSAN